jgi:hypothetical protein
VLGVEPARSLPQPTSRPTGVPRSVLAVLAALAVECAALLFLVARLYVYGPLTGQSFDAGQDIATAVFCLLLVAVLAACGRALWRGQRWARAPVVTLQLLILLALALPALRVGGWRLGVPLLVLSVVAGGGLFLPSAMDHTDGRANPPIA